MTDMISHKAGELILLSSGDYSDYGICGIFRALVDMDIGALATEYYEQCPMKSASESGFAGWLIKLGHIEDVDYDEVHCGWGFQPDHIRLHSHTRAEQLKGVDKKS